MLIIAGCFITYLVVKYDSSSNLFHRVSIQNCSHKPKYIFEGQSKNSRIQDKFNKNRKWTILLTVNNAYFDFFRNWYLAYLHLNISYPLVVVAEDGIVYKKLLPFQSKTVTIEKSGHDSAEKSASYGSKDFNKLVSQRPTHIQRHLKRGVNVLYSDTDMVWLQNPFSYFTGDFDMWIDYDGMNNFCTGLIASISNDHCITFMENWKKSLHVKLDIDQNAFNKVAKNASINISVLDGRKFPPGSLYFNKFTDEQRGFAVVAHNNWIVGHSAKLKRFKIFKLWYVK